MVGRGLSGSCAVVGDDAAPGAARGGKRIPAPRVVDEIAPIVRDKRGTQSGEGGEGTDLVNIKRV